MKKYFADLKTNVRGMLMKKMVSLEGLANYICTCKSFSSKRLLFNIISISASDENIYQNDENLYANVAKGSSEQNTEL